MTQVRATIIGCGGMARHHVRQMLQQPDSATIGLICEPSEAAYGQMAQAFGEIGLPPPPRLAAAGPRATGSRACTDRRRSGQSSWRCPR